MGDEEAYNAFLADHAVGNVVPYPSYTSTSTTKSGHPLEGKYVVNLEIAGESGRNVDGYGNNMEQEVLFPRDTAFEVTKIENINGIPTVYMQEVNYGQESGNGRLYQRNNSGEQGSPAESGTNKVQQMQEAPAGSEVQQVPDTYSGRNRVYEEGVSGVRAGVGVKPEQQAKTPAKKRSKPRTVESTERLEDFGEKIGGARKDWRTNGLNIDDLSDMNDRERKENVKKDNVWKRPDYKKLIEGGADRGILFGVNEIRKSLPATISYGYKWTEDVSEAKQREYISTIRAIQEVAGQAKEKNDFAKVISWLMDNGYLEIAESYGRKNFKSTNKYRENPALSGSTIVSTIGELTSSSFDLYDRALNCQHIAKKHAFGIIIMVIYALILYNTAKSEGKEDAVFNRDNYR